MSALDDTLNIVIPVLLILIAVGFLWIKLIKPWGWPLIQNMFEYFQNKKANMGSGKKEISYE